ncbi:MAG: FMN-binding negative transcriptional regulator [Acidimicrobiales bacterium]
MLIHPWDSAISADEWQRWLATTDLFGVLAVNNIDPQHAPVLVPTHFVLAPGADTLLVHLARPNPAWNHLEASQEVCLMVMGDYAFIPGYWRAAEGTDERNGVPTSYYTAVQFFCRPTIIDDPQEKAELLRTQLETFQPEGNHGEVIPEAPPYGSLLNGIRGLRLEITDVRAKFKYDDAKPVELRQRTASELDRRGQGLDHSAASAQRRRTSAIAEWRAFSHSRTQSER